jgi:hypothetical protein
MSTHRLVNHDERDERNRLTSSHVDILMSDTSVIDRRQ